MHLRCDEPTAIERLDRRQEAGTDVSDGRRELYRRQASTFEAPDGERGVIVIDSGDAMDYNIQFIMSEILRKAGRDE